MIAQLSSKATISLSFCMNAYEEIISRVRCSCFLSPETQVRPHWRSVGTCQVLRLGRTCTQQNGALGKPVPSGVSGGCVRSNPAAPGVWTNAMHNGGSHPRALMECALVCLKIGYRSPLDEATDTNDLARSSYAALAARQFSKLSHGHLLRKSTT